VQQQVISSPTPLPNNSPLPVVNWTSLFGDGESLTYDNATGRFTNNLNRNIAVTISFSCVRTGLLGNSDFYIQRTTGSEKWGRAARAGIDVCTGTATLFLANTDYFRIIAYQDGGFGQDVDGGTMTYVIH
jgi:phage baseplate assembly protein gpV